MRRKCYVAALPFQAHANYGTWSIDFAFLDISPVLISENDSLFQIVNAQLPIFLLFYLALK